MTPRRELVRHAGAVTLLAAVTLLFFSALFEGRTYSDVSRYQQRVFPWGDPSAPRADDRHWHIDQAKSNFPWQVFMSRTYQAGDVPLWNPFSFAGTPFLAANGSNALYPPRVALSATALEPTRVHDVFLAGHMFLAGLAMYVLLLYFRASFTGSLLGAIAWMASSFMLAWAALEHFVVAAALLPLAVLLADVSVRRRSWAATLALGVVLALLFLGGNVLFVALCFATIGAYIVCLIVGRLLRERRATGRSRELAGDLARLAVPWLVFAGISAVALLPTLELVGSISREPLSYAELKSHALPRGELVHLFIPPDTFAYLVDPLNPYHVALFSGTVVGVLAVVGALLARGPGAWLARVLGALTLLTALATPVLALPYVLLPGFDHLKPLGRALFLAVFAVAILAAFGLDIVSRAVERWIGGRSGIRAAAFVGIVAIALTIGHLRAYGGDVMHHQEATTRETYPETPLIARLRQREDVRFLGTDVVLPGSTALVYPLRNAAGYESLVPGRVQDFWRVVAGVPLNELTDPVSSAFEPVMQLDFMRSDLLWRAGIGYVAAPPAATGAQPSADTSERLVLEYSEADGRIYRVRQALPRAYFVPRCVVVEDSRAALLRFQERDFDPRSAVILERRADGDVPCSTTARGRAGGSARIVEDETNAVTVEVDAPTRGFLVLNDTWDPGWHAKRDGEEAEVLAANSVFRAVPVEQGRHTIDFRYSPRSYEIGRALSLGTLLLVLAILLAIGVRRVMRRETGT